MNETTLPSYTDLESIKKEIEDSKKLFKKYNWPTIDVTRKSIEETAASVIKIYDIRRRDVINSISIQGDPTNLFKRKAEDLETWNNTLDLNYPDLKPAFDVGNN